MAGRSGREVGSDDPLVQSPPQYHPCPIASSNSAPLFLGLFTCLLTGQTFNTSSPAGLRSVVGSPSTSPNHVGQSSGSSMAGIRSCSSPTVSFAFVVMMVNDRVTVPSGHLNTSQSPANAIAVRPGERWDAAVAVRASINF